MEASHLHTFLMDKHFLIPMYIYCELLSPILSTLNPSLHRWHNNPRQPSPVQFCSQTSQAEGPTVPVMKQHDFQCIFLVLIIPYVLFHRVNHISSLLFLTGLGWLLTHQLSYCSLWLGPAKFCLPFVRGSSPGDEDEVMETISVMKTI